jgi:glycosyltransferase involved in cell wall biosynthesis
MKILFFRETELRQLNPTVMLCQGLAGTENSVVCLAQELSKKHIVKVVAPQYKQHFFNKVEYIPFQSYAEVLIQIMVFNPDVLIVCGNPSILFEHKFSVQKIIFWQQNHPKELEGRFNIPIFFNNSLPYKIEVVAPSPEAASYYNNYYKTNKVIGIYNGVRDEFFNQHRNPIKNKISYCGSFTRAKGLNQVLLSSVDLPEYQFFLYGSFDLYGFIDQPFRDFCSQFKNTNIHFAGSLPAKQLAYEFSTSSLCIANPLENNLETCCISALEAIVVGTPVITGSSQILDSIVSRGGITTKNLTKTIKEFILSQHIYKNKEFIQSLSWSFIAKEWEKVLF